MRPAPRPFTLDPVRAIAQHRGLDDETLGRMMGRSSTASARRHAHRCQHDGLTFWEADRLATRLGLHPRMVWGDAYFTAQDGTEHLGELERLLKVLGAWVRAQLREDARDRASRAEWVRWCNERRPHRCALDGCRCGDRVLEVAA